MQHCDIFIFLHKDAFVIYANGEQRTPGGDERIPVKSPNSEQDTEHLQEFWSYFAREFMEGTWDKGSLAILYHDTSFSSCQSLVTYPCEHGLTALSVRTLDMAFPEILCKMDILKQEPCLVRFAESLWEVTPQRAKPLVNEPRLSAYTLTEKEIIDAYLRGFPIQGQRYVEATAQTNTPKKAVQAWIESSQVEAKRR